MGSAKQLWMLVGGNGAGKSTFYRKYLERRGMPFVNANVLAKQVFPDDPEGNSYEAAQLATQMREQLLIDGAIFCFETVFSHPSKIDFIAKAKAFGYQVVLVFIHVDNISLNKARISQRVEEGGHFVPDKKVETPIPRTLENIRNVLPLCDHVRFLDNSSYEDPFQQVVTIRNQTTTEHMQPLPTWAADLLHV
ncbi:MULTISPECIES: AAA family ATPase [unclassified Neptuniibacter]|uniref:AAA family ATPase n=1 Tax=unclassified Neptuniibacter TaxID=2630693 RepID=UPI0025F94939|nr:MULTISPECIES: AAA family ATPase [unclassified Neptuniibacter]|tara:strand:+ start:6431 stop:7009 length:579 start_codon:yes stop_codon:yes gene_type:complete